MHICGTMRCAARANLYAVQGSLVLGTCHGDCGPRHRRVPASLQQTRG
jgi:hypothetical protein